MGLFRHTIIIDERDKNIVTSGEINIDWSKRYLLCKKNWKTVWITIWLWYFCIMVFLPAGPITLVLFEWFWASINTDTVQWWVKYIFLIYALVGILVESIILFFVSNKKLISRYFIFNFYVKLYLLFDWGNSKKRKNIHEKREEKEGTNTEVHQETKKETEQSLKILIAKKRIKSSHSIKYFETLPKVFAMALNSLVLPVLTFLTLFISILTTASGVLGGLYQ